MRATAASVNSIFVQMASKVDQCEIKRLAESIGVHNACGAELASAALVLDRWLREQHRSGDRRRRLRGDREPGRLLRADHHRQASSTATATSSPGRTANCGQSAVSPAVANTAAYATGPAQ